MRVWAVVVCAAGGIVTGSFLNHLVLRWVGWRMVLPPLLGWDPLYSAGRGARAACRSCGARLDIAGLPVLPYVVRAGRCGSCRTRLNRRHLVVELATAGLFALAAARIDRWEALVPVLVLFAFLVAVSAIDIEVQRIPTRFVYATLAVSLPLIVAASVRLDVPRAAVGAVIGSLAYFGFLFLFHLISPRRMGFGDVRLALVMGLFLGWFGWTADFPVLGPVALVIWGALVGSLLGSVVGVVVIVASRRNRYFPFGPALAFGTIVVVLFSSELRVG